MKLTDHELWVLRATLDGLESSYDWKAVERIKRKLETEVARRGNASWAGQRKPLRLGRYRGGVEGEPSGTDASRITGGGPDG